MLIGKKTKSFLVFPSSFGNQKVSPELLLLFLLIQEFLLIVSKNPAKSFILIWRTGRVLFCRSHQNLFSLRTDRCLMLSASCTTIDLHILVACSLLELFLSSVFIFADSWCIPLSFFFLFALFFFYHKSSNAAILLLLPLMQQIYSTAIKKKNSWSLLCSLGHNLPVVCLLYSFA